MELRPLNGKTELKLYELGDALEFDLAGAGFPDWVKWDVFAGTGYAVGSATWASGAIVTAQIRGDGPGGGGDYVGFPTAVTFIAFSSVTNVDRQRVTGMSRARLRVTTKGGTTETLWVACSCGWDK